LKLAKHEVRFAFFPRDFACERKQLQWDPATNLLYWQFIYLL